MFITIILLVLIFNNLLSIAVPDDDVHIHMHFDKIGQQLGTLRKASPSIEQNNLTTQFEMAASDNNLNS